MSVTEVARHTLIILSQREGLYHRFFFFNDTATTEIYTLSLHDALPISSRTFQETGDCEAYASLASRSRRRCRNGSNCVIGRVSFWRALALMRSGVQTVFQTISMSTSPTPSMAWRF